MDRKFSEELLRLYVVWLVDRSFLIENPLFDEEVVGNILRKFDEASLVRIRSFRTLLDELDKIEVDRKQARNAKRKEILRLYTGGRYKYPKLWREDFERRYFHSAFCIVAKALLTAEDDLEEAVIQLNLSLEPRAEKWGQVQLSQRSIQFASKDNKLGSVGPWMLFDVLEALAKDWS